MDDRQRAEKWAERLRLQFVGAVFVAVLSGLVALTVAQYSKVFDNHVNVTVEAKKSALQLNPNGDVRMNGAIVGRIAHVHKSPTGASIEIQIDQDSAATIPVNVKARILPTTLFGQKYVSLESDGRQASQHLTNGSTISQDNSSNAVELTDAIDNLQPVLTAIDPAGLAKTLNAAATGLDGRGRQLGKTINRATDYLAAINAETPHVDEDFTLLARVTGNYATAAPDFLKLLDNAAVTSKTIRGSNDELGSFFLNVTDAATASEKLLRRNEHNLIEATRLARPTLELLAEYSPQIVCTLQGLESVKKVALATLRNGFLHATMTVGGQTPGYTASDHPEFGDIGTGPNCRGLPAIQIPAHSTPSNDGVDNKAGGPNALSNLLLGPLIDLKALR